MGQVCCAQKDDPLGTTLPVDFQDRLDFVLDFWFQCELPDGSTDLSYDRESSLPPRYILRWFKQSEQFDSVVKEKFEQDFVRLEQGLYDEWATTHDGRLGLIILTD